MLYVLYKQSLHKYREEVCLNFENALIIHVLLCAGGIFIFSVFVSKSKRMERVIYQLCEIYL